MRRWVIFLATILLMTTGLAVGPSAVWQSSADDHKDEWINCSSLPPLPDQVPPTAARPPVIAKVLAVPQILPTSEPGPWVQPFMPALGQVSAAPQVPPEYPPLPAEVYQGSAVVANSRTVEQFSELSDQLPPVARAPVIADPPAAIGPAPEVQPLPPPPITITLVPQAPPAISQPPATPQAQPIVSQSPATPQAPPAVSQPPATPRAQPAVSQAPAMKLAQPAVSQPATTPMDLPLPTPMPGVVETHIVSDDPFNWMFGGLNHGGHSMVTGEAEYVVWFLKGNNPAIPIATSGVLGSTTSTTSQVGDNDASKGPTSGGRFTFGYWQYDNNPWAAQGIVRTFGVEARFFFVGNVSSDFNTDAAPNLSRPFYDLNNHVDSGFPVSVPGVMTGEVSAHGQASIWGAEANVWKNAFYDRPGTTYAIDFMAGFRYVNATSELDINSNSTFNNTIPAASPYAAFAGNRLQVNDSFATRNDFFGGQIGIGLKSWVVNCISFEGSLRMAFGETFQESNIAGSQVRTFANSTTTTSAGGLLALPSNSGTRTNSEFTQIPEAQFKVLWPVSKQITLSLGFTTLYWNHILRAANQVDRTIDITQIPNFPGAAGATPTGLQHPSLTFQQSSLWLLGISAGLEYCW